MVLADKQVDAAFGAVKNQMQAAIVQHMTEAAINCQAGNRSTATHFAASHADRSLVSKEGIEMGPLISVKSSLVKYHNLTRYREEGTCDHFFCSGVSLMIWKKGHEI